MRGTCRDCGQPTNRCWQAIYCQSCALLHRRAAKRRYRLSPKAKLLDRKRHLTPREKLRSAVWCERNIERVREYKRKYRRKIWKPVIVNCAATLCQNQLLRSGKRGALKFCFDCAAAFYGKNYAMNRKVA